MCVLGWFDTCHAAGQPEFYRGYAGNVADVTDTTATGSHLQISLSAWACRSLFACCCRIFRFALYSAHGNGDVNGNLCLHNPNILCFRCLFFVCHTSVYISGHHLVFLFSGVFMKLVLASSSPFRAAILRNLALPFAAVSPEVDESPLSGEAPQALVERLLKTLSLSVKQMANLRVWTTLSQGLIHLK